MNRLLALALIAAASLAAESLLAQDRLALVGGRLIDGYGGRPVANSVILVDGDTITAVGSVASLPVPEGYRIVEDRKYKPPLRSIQDPRLGADGA